jgi:hypothetical protein
VLKLLIEGSEMFDEATSTFSTVGDVTLTFEHSLVSLSKWESEFQKPFLTPGEKTSEEIFAYIKAMILTEDYDSSIISRLNQAHLDQINSYIESPQSATTFGYMPETTGRGETITSELVYYWLVAFNIPFECERWHLNRLFALIRICNIKNSKPKKMSRSDLAKRNRDLNAQRKAQMNTTG